MEGAVCAIAIPIDSVPVGEHSRFSLEQTDLGMKASLIYFVHGERPTFGRSNDHRFAKGSGPSGPGPSPSKQKVNLSQLIPEPPASLTCQRVDGAMLVNRRGAFSPGSGFTPCQVRGLYGCLRVRCHETRCP
jgi:hypothetical protein